MSYQPSLMILEMRTKPTTIEIDPDLLKTIEHFNKKCEERPEEPIYRKMVSWLMELANHRIKECNRISNFDGKFECLD